MLNILTVEDVAKIVNKHGFDEVMRDLMAQIKSDFARWDEFNKIPRPAFHVKDGVIELMPIADNEYFGFKYVNGHPINPSVGKQTVVATGQLSRVVDGYPILMTEMTLLTALRTAATAAIATDYLARQDAQTIALLGTGAQSDFQTLAHALVRDVKTVRYHDIDPDAMKRYARNMGKYDFELVPCDSNEEAVKGADIIIVCTACKKHAQVVMNAWVKDGMHINGLGGDCPGKTELESSILLRSKNVVEFFDQSFIEGEIQNFAEPQARKLVYAELWELITNQKPGRVNNQEITVFDSVGFALEDFSVLKLMHRLAEKYQIGRPAHMIPPIEDPKDLFPALQIVRQPEFFEA